MNIHMYNVWFGDCFRIEKNSSNLIVDFGIHRSSSLYRYISTGKTIKRRDVHNEIAEDILKLKECNLLITHFHDDHISGLLHMKKHLSATKVPLFNCVYIPDIWGVPDGAKIVALHLLEELLERSKLSSAKSSISLLELVRFLCADVKNVIFTRRGTEVENGSYIALWPDPELVGNCANTLLKKIVLRDDFYNTLIDISKKLCTIVLECADREHSFQRIEGYLERLDGLERELIELSKSVSIIEMLARIEAEDGDLENSYLNNFKNKISIVFQNQYVTNENLLFTGDVERDYLDKILINYDKNPKCNIHSKYCYIKVPHHGTRGTHSEYHYDFTKYEPRVLMIPNGSCGTDGFKICKEYGIDIKAMPMVKVYCSNSNWCENNLKQRFCSCQCIKHEIIFPKISKRISF